MKRLIATGGSKARLKQRKGALPKASKTWREPRTTDGVKHPVTVYKKRFQ